ncbi:hypothetical protein B0H19DRAFT_1276766 [Mycena capillaripes]|nr:hypothetical protein B0H19DRAFT_1276766 [Mycena capillaripes]
MSADQAKLLLQLALDSRTTEYCAVASLTLVLFEWLISMRREVDLVWTRRKSLVKWLYVSYMESIFFLGHDIILYLWYTFPDAVIHVFNPPPQSTYAKHHRMRGSSSSFHDIKMCLQLSSCFRSQQVQGTSATIIIGTVDVILLLRCNMDPLRAIATSVKTAEFVVMLCITTTTVNNLTEFVHVGFVKGCYSPDVPKYFAAYPIPSLIVSCLMFCVTVRICYRRIAVSRLYNTQSIAMVFLRDGVLWFLVIVLINPPQIALWGWGRPSLIQVLMMPSLAAYSIVGARVLLNMMAIAAGSDTVEDELWQRVDA